MFFALSLKEEKRKITEGTHESKWSPQSRRKKARGKFNEFRIQQEGMMQILKGGKRKEKCSVHFKRTN